MAPLRRDAGASQQVTNAVLYRNDAGMLVALLPEPHSNLVRVDVRYRSGAAQDPAGRSGLAHLVEHLTFHLRKSKNSPTLADRLSRDSLAFNAYTRWDETHYFATAFAPQLDSLLAVEADRLSWGCDELSPGALDDERRVVERELETRQSGTSALDALRRAVFAAGHPYHREVGGARQQIGAITLTDVCRFLDQRYQPEHAIMVISGRFDIDSVKASLEARHGALRAIESMPQLRAQPGTQTAKSRRGRATQTLRADVASPALVVLVESVRWGSPEGARRALALSVFIERLQDRVRADDTVLATTGPVHLGGWDSGLRGIVIHVRTEDDLDHARRLVQDLGTSPLHGLDDGAVMAARERYRARMIAGHDSLSARAVSTADTLHYAGEPGIEPMLKATAAMSRGNIERAIARDLDSALMVRVLPAGGDARSSGNDRAALSDTEPRGLVATDGHGGDIDSPWVPLVDDREADRDLVLPAMPARAPVHFTTLANGMEVVLVPRPGSPMVHARMVFAGGEQAEPAGHRGMAMLAASLRKPGMSAPWSQQLAGDLAAIASLPVDIDASVESTATMFEGSSPLAHASALLWNLHLHVRYGGYVGLSDVGKILLRKRFDASADQRRSSVEGMIGAVIAGENSSKRELAALKATVSRLQPQDLAGHAARAYRPEKGVLIVAGDFDTRTMLAAIEELFAGWRPRAVAGAVDRAPASPPTRDASTAQHVLLADAARAQPRVVVVYPGVIDDSSRAAGAVLRGIVEARLTRELRESMAATYSVSVSFKGDALVIDTELSSRAAVIAAGKIRTIVAELVDDRFRADFIRARRKAVEQALASSMSTALVIERVSRARLAGMATDPLEQMGRDIARLRPGRVAELAETRLRTARASWIIAARKDQGQALFRSFGIEQPLVVP